MTRIIGGVAGGRRIETLAGRDTRPTTDRVREALFSRLEHDGWLAGTRVLDLYSGSGALGLEAASRGARDVLLIEHFAAAVRMIRRNIDLVGIPGVSVSAARVERRLAGVADGPYDLALVDPPYGIANEALGLVLGLLLSGLWLAAETMVVVERSARNDEPDWPPGLELVHSRVYGQTRLWFATGISVTGKG